MGLSENKLLKNSNGLSSCSIHFPIFSLLNGLLVAVSPIFKPRDFPWVADVPSTGVLTFMGPAWDWTAHKDRPGAASS